MSHIASKTLIFGATYLLFVLPMPVSPIFGRQVIRGRVPTWTEKRDTGKYDEIWLANIIYPLVN